MIRYCLAALLLSRSLLAQAPGFVTTLGSDTVQVEQFSRAGGRVWGLVVQRTPSMRWIRWAMTLDAAGRPLRYEARVQGADGAAIRNGSGSMTFTGDSIIRESYLRDSVVTTRLAASAGTYPGPSLPYVGVSYLMYEWALRDARARAGADTSIAQLTFVAGQARPSRTRAWLVGSDSAELDYFGVARSGYKFDREGRLIRADWSGTTYRYRIERVASIDVEAIGARWSAAEKAGRPFGALSPRDSVVGTIDGSRYTIDYSRPSKRGRAVWSTIVPADRVWRLGADMATHFITAADLDIGGAVVPAGRYTLWMVQSATSPVLVISRAVNVFGTNYDPSKDLARVPLSRRTAGNVTERLTLSIDNGIFAIAWDDLIWTVPVKVRR